MRTKRKAIEFITDPSSGELSASRLLLCVLILVYLPALGALEALGVKMGIWTHFAMIVSAVAGVYGVNTAGRVWREGGDRGFREGQALPPAAPPSGGPSQTTPPTAKKAPPIGDTL